MCQVGIPEKAAVSSCFQAPQSFRWVNGDPVWVCRGGVRESVWGMWGRSFWGWQRLDKSYLNSTLCKMPCVNSCPWPKHSDLVKQTLKGLPVRPYDTIIHIHSGCKQCGFIFETAFWKWRREVQEEEFDDLLKEICQQFLQFSAMFRTDGLSDCSVNHEEKEGEKTVKYYINLCIYEFFNIFMIGILMIFPAFQNKVL